MKSGIFEIDGVEYPDADASDPNSLGWMQGSPPPQAKLIRFQDDRFLEFPQSRWTLSHMRELAPTAAVWRGSAAPSDLGQAPRGLEAAIDALAFEDLQGHRLTWAQSLKHTYADGIIVLHRGRRIYERYFGALEAQRSITWPIKIDRPLPDGAIIKQIAVHKHVKHPPRPGIAGGDAV